MESNVIQQRVPINSDPGHWVHVSDSPRNVRVIFGDETIADSKRVKLLRESSILPVYYFPKQDVRMDLLAPTAHTTACPYKGEATYWTARSGDKIAENAAWWFEEDEEIFVHPRDPFKRVDALPSKRHVRVVIDGKTVAETRRPHLLFETNHPVRYYIPREDVRMDYLVSSATRSRCPYKGPASYWSAKIGDQVFEDMIWGYMEPIPECPKIKGLLCFFHERGAEIFVDDEKILPPQTKWARALKSK